MVLNCQIYPEHPVEATAANLQVNHEMEDNRTSHSLLQTRNDAQALKAGTSAYCLARWPPILAWAASGIPLHSWLVMARPSDVGSRSSEDTRHLHSIDIDQCIATRETQLRLHTHTHTRPKSSTCTRTSAVRNTNGTFRHGQSSETRLTVNAKYTYSLAYTAVGLD